jgi:hypothetical protein
VELLKWFVETSEIYLLGGDSIYYFPSVHMSTAIHCTHAVINFFLLKTAEDTNRWKLEQWEAALLVRLTPSPPVKQYYPPVAAAKTERAYSVRFISRVSGPLDKAFPVKSFPISLVANKYGMGTFFLDN